MNDKRLIPVRLSHLLSHCSVGSVVRGPDYLLVVRDIREWTNPEGLPVGRVIPYVEQVKAAMEIDSELREPPIAANSSKGVQGYCVPADIFPTWMRCVNPRCGALHYKPWRGDDTFSLTCRICHKGKLEQVPWVLAHEDGHLADVPWHFIAHNNKNATSPEQKNCKRTWDHPYLRLVKHGPGNMELRCNTCNAVNKFDVREPIPFRGNRQPWSRDSAEISEKSAEIIEVNDTRLHMALTQNALVIPPESRVRKGSVVDRLYASSDKLRKVKLAKNDLQKRQALRIIIQEFRCTLEELEAAIEELEKGYPLYGREITKGLLLESEYDALTGVIPDLSDDEDFVPRHLIAQWQEMSVNLPPNSQLSLISKLIDAVVSVERLKEIMVLKGFQRLSREDGALVPPDIVGGTNWLPALELYGEGLFITFSEAVLNKWESQDAAIKRAKELNNRFLASDYRFTELVVSPRFLFLHTLSHMLIKELESQAGYPAASLKERIYCSTQFEKPMAGILIYIAVPDVVGSLGGLAELARPQRLLALLARVFSKAEWCSFDPVCSEHQGQGPALLNKAACHACALIPEPSCAHGNVLLDRLFVRGDAVHDLHPILSFVKSEQDGQA